MNTTLGTVPALNRFQRKLQEAGLGRLTRAPLSTLQINVGKRCNQACHHCHVDAGPKRTEVMTWETMTRILSWARSAGIEDVDITGGAPEINPHFRDLVDALIGQNTAVTSRCNLTVLWEPGQEDLAVWYASRGVRLVCSLPCYTQKNVDAQRGDGVFAKSIAALQKLNGAGYGKETGLALDLVYNPGGAFLPGEQTKLETDYKARLREDFGIEFSRLLTLANLPINRFAHFLEREGLRENYEQLLFEKFNPGTVPGLMCRHLLSVDWQGRVYDCDFNQMLELPQGGVRTRFLWEIDSNDLPGAAIHTASHCFGCTAGSGSSCGGALL